MKKKSTILIASFIIVAISAISIPLGCFIYFNTPSARSGLCMVYDKSIRKVILFGGGYQDSSSYTYFDDTWSYDPFTNIWSEILTQSNPTARSSHSMVYDPIHEKIILFGGIDLNGRWLSETWVFDSRINKWSQVFPENNPPSRGSTSIFYDPQAQKVIIFGGYREVGGHFDDTWMYDYSTNNWTNLSPLIKPMGRYGASMVYDPVNQRGIMFGGRISSLLIANDTWVYYYLNNTWVELNVFNAPESRYWEGLVYDETVHKVVLFGGRGSGGTDESFDDTWILDPSNNQWTEMFQTSHPSGRFFFPLVYDSGSKKTILFGGFRFPNINFDETWSYNYHANSWILLKGAISN